MDYKVCTVCGEKKSIDNFTTGRKQCIVCIRKLTKDWRNRNKEHIKEYNKKYFQKHKEEIVNKRREYLHNYRQTEKYKKHKKEYEMKNRQKSNEHRKNRYKNDYIFKLKHNLRVELLRSFKSKNKIKYKHTEEIIGCDTDFFIDYLLNTFKENYGYEYTGQEKVHIDHIIPLATASDENDIIKLCHYTNLQLLKATDNLKKSSIYRSKNDM